MPIPNWVEDRDPTLEVGTATSSFRHALVLNHRRHCPAPLGFAGVLGEQGFETAHWIDRGLFWQRLTSRGRYLKIQSPFS
jgi:hypothetical protein